MTRTFLPPALCALALLGACATPPAPPDADGWSELHLPGKEATRYQWGHKDGRSALAAESDNSASVWRKRLEPGVPLNGPVRFSWWVQDLVPGASVADSAREDAPARVVFGFAGDTSTLPARTRAMFDFMHALTGERPPYATLMYVWDSHLPVGTVVVNARSDRVRKIVVDSGPTQLRRWRDHERDLAADFRLAFGEEPGLLTSVGVMTDSDNTQSRGRSWYGPVAWM